MKQLLPVWSLLFCLVVTGSLFAQRPGEFVYDRQSDLYYSTWVGSDTFHIIIKAVDPMQQMKMARNGVEVWVDTRGKTSKRSGFRYPLPSEGEMMQQPQQSYSGRRDSARSSMRPMVVFMLMTKKEVEIVGLKENINGKHELEEKTGIDIAIDFLENDTLRYQANMPFSAFNTAISAENPLSVGIIIKGMERPSFGDSGGSAGSGAPAAGSRGGGARGGRGGGGGGSNSNGNGGGNVSSSRNMEKMFSDNSIWVKFNQKQ